MKKELTEGQLEIKAALENVIRLASRHDIHIAGFTFSAEPPLIINFGNVSDMGDIKLYEKLVEMANRQREYGNAINSPVGEVH